MSSIGSSSPTGSSGWSAAGGPLPKPVAPEVQTIQAELDQCATRSTKGAVRPVRATLDES